MLNSYSQQVSCFPQLLIYSIAANQERKGHFLILKTMNVHMYEPQKEFGYQRKRSIKSLLPHQKRSIKVCFPV